MRGSSVSLSLLFANWASSIFLSDSLPGSQTWGTVSQQNLNIKISPLNATIVPHTPLRGARRALMPHPLPYFPYVLRFRRQIARHSLPSRTGYSLVWKIMSGTFRIEKKCTYLHNEVFSKFNERRKCFYKRFRLKNFSVKYYEKWFWSHYK